MLLPCGAGWNPAAGWQPAWSAGCQPARSLTSCPTKEHIFNMRMLPCSAWLLLMVWGLPAAPPQQAEERALSNNKLRVHLRPNLTLSVEDLATQVTWGSDPWENSAGRVHLHGKHGETVTVSLSGAAQKKIDTLPAANGEGFQISLSDFRSRMGPVRDDRDPGAHLSLVLQILLSKDSPELTLRIQATGPVGPPSAAQWKDPPQIGQCTQSRAILSAAPGPRR